MSFAVNFVTGHSFVTEQRSQAVIIRPMTRSLEHSIGKGGEHGACAFVRDAGGFGASSRGWRRGRCMERARTGQATAPPASLRSDAPAASGPWRNQVQRYRPHPLAGSTAPGWLFVFAEFRRFGMGGNFGEKGTPIPSSHRRGSWGVRGVRTSP